MIHLTGRRSLRILVVDGHRDSGDSLALLLRLWGHEAEVAHSGPEALEAVAAQHPDVVLTEIMLPKMDGFQLAGHLRQQPDSRGVLLIALTGVGGETHRRRAQETGFDQFLLKPVDPQALEKLLTLNYLSAAEFAAEPAGVIMEHSAQPEKWYYKEKGGLIGPVSAEQVRQLLAGAQLRPGDMVWRRWRHDPDTLFFPAPAAAVLERLRPAAPPVE